MTRMNIDDGDMFLAEFEGGGLASVQSSFVTVGNYPGIEVRIYGSEGAIIVRLVEEDGICQTIRTATKDAVEFVEREIPRAVLPDRRHLAGGLAVPLLLQPRLRLRHRDPGGRRGEPGRLPPGRAGAAHDQRLRGLAPPARVGRLPPEDRVSTVDRSTSEAAHAWGGLDDTTARALLEEALGAATGEGVTFADVRLVEAEEERLYTDLRGELDERREHNAGLGVRVLRDGVWGFASAPLGGPGTARDVARRAVAVAAAAAGTAPVVLAPRAADQRHLGGAGRRRPLRGLGAASGTTCSSAS